MVRLNSRGSVTSASCSQVIGVLTGAPGRARRLQALAIVRSRLFWLKSMKIRSPRSSFHQFVVTPVVAPLELPAESDGGVPDVLERSSRLDAQVDVDAAVAAGLGKPPKAELDQQFPGDVGDPLRVGEGRAGLRVEVEPQLVRVVDVGTPHRPRVEGQRTHLRGPDQIGRLGRAQLVGRAAAGERDLHGLDEVGRTLGQPLLIEAVGVAVLRPDGQPHALTPAVRPALHRRRSLADRPHQRVAHAGEVLAHLQLGDRRSPVGGLVDDPVRAGHPNLALAHADLCCRSLGHRPTVVGGSDRGPVDRILRRSTS